MNGGGVSNGAYSGRNNNQKAANSQFKFTSTESDYKEKTTLKDIVRKAL